MSQTSQIDERIKEVDTMLRSNRWAYSVIFQMQATLAQLETAKALSRIADRMENENGTSK